MRSLNMSRIAAATMATAVLLAAGTAGAYTTTKYSNMTIPGQNMNFVFTGLPVATGNVSVKIDLYGDYEANDELAEVWVDNIKQANHTGGGTKTRPSPRPTPCQPPTWRTPSWWCAWTTPRRWASPAPPAWCA